MQQKSKNSLITFIIVISALLMCFAGCENKGENKPNYSYNDSLGVVEITGQGTHYKNGDTIYPSYAISDTVIVINAGFLNEEFKNRDIATDEDISEVVGECTIAIADYEGYILTVGKK